LEKRWRSTASAAAYWLGNILREYSNCLRKFRSEAASRKVPGDAVNHGTSNLVGCFTRLRKSDFEPAGTPKRVFARDRISVNVHGSGPTVTVAEAEIAKGCLAIARRIPHFNVNVHRDLHMLPNAVPLSRQRRPQYLRVSLLRLRRSAVAAVL